MLHIMKYSKSIESEPSDLQNRRQLFFFESSPQKRDNEDTSSRDRSHRSDDGVANFPKTATCSSHTTLYRRHYYWPHPRRNIVHPEQRCHCSHHHHHHHRRHPQHYRNEQDYCFSNKERTGNKRSGKQASTKSLSRIVRRKHP